MDRGSWFTQLICCPDCLSAAKAVLLKGRAGWTGESIGPQGRILTGFINASAARGEILRMSAEIAPQIKTCHPLIIVVVTDCGYDASGYCAAIIVEPMPPCNMDYYVEIDETLLEPMLRFIKEPK